MELFMKSSYRAILTDVTQMLERYMSLVNNFPVAFNGTKLRQTIDSLISQLNKVNTQKPSFNLGFIRSFMIVGVGDSVRELLNLLKKYIFFGFLIFLKFLF